LFFHDRSLTEKQIPNGFYSKVVDLPFKNKLLYGENILVLERFFYLLI